MGESWVQGKHSSSHLINRLSICRYNQNYFYLCGSLIIMKISVCCYMFSPLAAMRSKKCILWGCCVRWAKHKDLCTALMLDPNDKLHSTEIHIEIRDVSRTWRQTDQRKVFSTKQKQLTVFNQHFIIRNIRFVCDPCWSLLCPCDVYSLHYPIMLISRDDSWAVKL